MADQRWPRLDGTPESSVRLGVWSHVTVGSWVIRTDTASFGRAAGRCVRDGRAATPELLVRPAAPGPGTIPDALRIVLLTVLFSVRFSVIYPVYMTTSATRLRKAPLVHVLAQVVFPSLPTWMESLPALQRALYDMGYIRMQEHTGVEVNFEIRDAPSPPITKQTVHVRYEFADREQRTAFVLTASSFVFHTTGYHGFPWFISELTRGLDALQATTAVQVVDRIGLRYVDLIQLQSGQSFGVFVHQGLLGYPFRATPQLGGTRVGFASGSMAVTRLGTLAIRSAVLPPGQFVPPDLEVGTLRPPSWVDSALPGLALDFDHFSIFSGPTTTGPMDFVVGEIAGRLSELHTTVRSAFEAIITDEAVALWGGWEEVTE